MTPTDVVVFRRWKDGGNIIALFPELPADLYGNHCDAYEHVGQHGGADWASLRWWSEDGLLPPARDLLTRTGRACSLGAWGLAPTFQ